MENLCGFYDYEAARNLREKNNRLCSIEIKIMDYLRSNGDTFLTLHEFTKFCDNVDVFKEALDDLVAQRWVRIRNCAGLAYEAIQ